MADWSIFKKTEETPGADWSIFKKEEDDWMARLGSYLREKINLPEGASQWGFVKNLAREIPGLMPTFGTSQRMLEQAEGMGRQTAERIVTEETEKERLRQHMVPEKGEVPPGKAQYIAEQIPVAGVFPRTWRQGAETWYNEPLRNFMDLLILGGGVKGFAKGRGIEKPPTKEIAPVEKPIREVAPEPKMPEIPVQRMEAVETPTGEPIPRGLSLSIEERAIENKLTDSFGEIPEYQRMNLREQAQKANVLLKEDYAKAKRIAMGEEGAPKGLYPENVMEAVELKATQQGDVATLMDLAKNSKLIEEATIMGQRIKSLDVGWSQRPVTAIRSIERARERAVGGRLKTMEKVGVKEIKSRVAQNVGNEWAQFIESIRC